MMHEPIETIEYRGMKALVFQDEWPDDPRDWNNLGTMVCWHRRYTLGDVQPEESPMRWLRELIEEWVDDPWELDDDEVWKAVDEHFIFLPVYLLDHSWLRISVSDFGDPWDSGQVGWIYVSKEKLEKEGISEADAIAALVREVSLYDDYLTGNVFGYVIDGTECSCWGFYGNDFEKNGLIERAHADIDHLINIYSEIRAEADEAEVGETFVKGGAL